MNKTVTIIAIALLITAIALGDTIWSEDFNTIDDDGKGAIGPTPTITTPASGKWSVNVDNCSLTATSDYFMVKNSLFEAADVDGTQISNGGGAGAVWISQTIDISAYSDVAISISASESGTMEDKDFIKASYKIDSGDITQFAKEIDDFTAATLSTTGLSGTSLTIYVEIDNNAGTEFIRFDDVIVTGTLSGGIDDPSSFSATASSASQIDLSWTQNSNTDNVMIIYDTDNTFTDPVDGTTYSVSSSVLGGTVIYNQSGSAFSHTSLSGGTTYYYKAWSVDGSNNYSAGVTDNASTLKAEPTNHPSSFAATSDHNSIELTWSDNDGAVAADGYLIKASSTALEDISPAVDGTAETDDNNWSDDQAVINIAHGTQTYEFTELSAETTYYFTIWAYTNYGTNIDYKTDRPLTTLSQATTAAPNFVVDIDFELAGGYTTNIAEFTDSVTDYFIRTDGSNIGSENFTNIQGDYYFAAQDLDGEGATLPLTLTIDDADISNLTDLNFSIMMAEDDAPDATEDWDDADYVHIDYDIDNSGSFTNLLHVAAAGGTNTVPMIDTDFDGTGDGTVLTNVFTEFSASISGTGSLMDIRITFNLDSGDEDIALDNIRLTGSGSQPAEPEPSNHVLDFTGTASYNSITLSWSDNDGSTAAENFLIKAGTTSLEAIGDPVDGVLYDNDTDLSDGTAVMTIASGIMSYSWSDLDPSTAYYFKIYPYTNSGADTDYKTDGSVPSFAVTTDDLPKIIITEIMINPEAISDLNGEWFELYNAGEEAVDINGWQICDNGVDNHVIDNSGALIIEAKDRVVLGIDNDTLTNGNYTCNYVYSNISMANAEDEVIIKSGATIIDSVAYNDAASWTIPSAASMVYIGAETDDNNLYSNWTTSDTREGTFVGETGDLGTPGGSKLINALLNILVFIEGGLKSIKFSFT